MKALVIYHANCADGFGAAFAAWLKLGDEAEYRPMKYGKDYSLSENTFEIKDREIYILDFSFPRGVMDLMFKLAKRVVWLDHHQSAFEMWCGAIPECGSHVEQHGLGYHRLDTSKSGAMLSWNYFHPGTDVPMFIQHIDDYDRWQFKLDGTKEFNKGLWSHAPWSFDQWNELLAGARGESLYAEGAAILRAHNQNVESVVAYAARPCVIENGKPPPYAAVGQVVVIGANHFDVWRTQGLAANCPPHLTSDVGHELANQSGTYGLCWTLNQTKPVANCSLRSNGDYDVSAIAKAFGGGGHKNAAGFEVPIDVLLEWLK
jgi:oligoribonuclease NrnB/cAMP/cGMP phosphodiesterase (DHH superfamily)